MQPPEDFETSLATASGVDASGLTDEEKLGGRYGQELWMRN